MAEYGNIALIHLYISCPYIINIVMYALQYPVRN